ncbi:UPF0598 protein C8orf82 [Amphibalanus amphitrite]|uniref:UPF0598 protein C8orf82 n=1 Tax=Amphibalanus amphitrite TaxID=1232801 RepID=A0A6A4WE11_AMPAM|nr:UPF0598 protein CG30010-like [Amphibalanus amphitrite]KAF0301121.1 UPF0598 protein C8orf82 [Amphibalanus amphitrite]KAF0301122.1 UPF0598 protein C8orf82 [Amphibalanus amphitrite]
MGMLPALSAPLRPTRALVRRCLSGPAHLGPFSDYVQGQSPAPNVREYFYYIDHQGMLFLDDAKMKNFTSCIKEQKFLRFFFNQLRMNDTERYPEFPFISPCGRERNFVRCNDLPIVFTHVLAPSDGSSNFKLSYNHAGALLSTAFDPHLLCMLPGTGRVYHPGPARSGGVGLVRSALAIEFSRGFRFDKGETMPPTHFQWEGETYKLTNELVPALLQMRGRCNMDAHPSDT